MKKIVLLYACVLGSIFAAPTGPAGMQFDMSQLPPGVTQQDLERAAKEVDEFFKNMSEDDMKSFMEFVHDVETGKVDINELLPPGMQMQPPTKQPAPAGPKAQVIMPKGSEVATIKTEPQEQVKPMLRNKKNAEIMLKELIEHLTSLRSKASTYAKVAEQLTSLYESLDMLMYYLHALSKKEHIDQLVTDPDLLRLHDALRSLNEVLKAHEPQVRVPEFGLDIQDPQIKSSSKKALGHVVNTLETSLLRERLISLIEQLFQKYEPAALKKRKSAEEKEARAQQEAVAQKQWQQVPANVRTEPMAMRERAYGERDRFLDWFYGPRREEHVQRPEAQKRMLEKEAPGARAGREMPAIKKKGEEKEAKPEKEMKEKKEEKPLKERVARTFPVPAPQTTQEMPVYQKIQLLAQAYDTVYELAEKEIAGQPFYKKFPIYLQDVQTNVSQLIDQARHVNDRLDELITAMHRCVRERAKIEQGIRTLPAVQREAYLKGIALLQERLHEVLDPIYEAISKAVTDTRGALEQVVPPSSSAAEKKPLIDGKLYMHLGYQCICQNQLPQEILDANPTMENKFSEFQMGYEHFFKKQRGEQAKNRAADYQALLKQEIDRSAQCNGQPRRTPHISETVPQSQPDEIEEPILPEPEIPQQGKGMLKTLTGWLLSLFGSGN